MKVGTKSILFGAHQFLIHPLFVALAWWKLYGFPWDVRLWVALIVHDWGYWGSPDMDGTEGEQHTKFGARICGHLFGPEWRDFCLYHSRFAAVRDGKRFSRLCVADKLSIVLEPAWLYLPRVRLSGEIHEYMALADSRTAAGEPKYASMKLCTNSERRWFADVQEYLRRWVNEHRDGKVDTWTPNIKANAAGGR
ncbi:MAG: hypothetical protein LLG06_19675 [Desulfobacteraceae bacterium]|nr:hypothetical protein [Desulfobacteraceae bacterium]